MRETLWIAVDERAAGPAPARAGYGDEAPGAESGRKM